MERRKILLGSGAALATALAGCSETSGGSDDDSSDDGGSDDGGSDNGDDNGSNGTDDVPGFDGSKLDIDSDALSISSIEKKDDTVQVLVETDLTDYQELIDELKPLAGKHDDAIDDIEAFIAEVDTIEWIAEHDGAKVVSLFVDVEWVVSFLEDELSEEEFGEKVKETAE
ncbi:hypothetical protein SAMN04487967_2646 [Natronorubrum sediminis]|uniref:DUF8159 domain-containing protein n=1 Tax=Natronorubrum sediminis TaxID=640943 RepID=A0A1H6G1X9_9EURY|nr:hypothetical protein [Natronorubrum sediminis]SEH16468.1 hypothetical protein SAMN04487967_2646 [Natronorubrum sediminis]